VSAFRTVNHRHYFEFLLKYCNCNRQLHLSCQRLLTHLGEERTSFCWKISLALSIIKKPTWSLVYISELCKKSDAPTPDSNPVHRTESTKMAAVTVGKAARAKKRSNASIPKNGTNRRSKSNGHNSDYLDPELLLTVLSAVKNGDFTGRFPTRNSGGVSGEISKRTSSSHPSSDVSAKLSVRKVRSRSAQRSETHPAVGHHVSIR